MVEDGMEIDCPSCCTHRSERKYGYGIGYFFKKGRKLCSYRKYMYMHVYHICVHVHITYVYMHLMNK